MHRDIISENKRSELRVHTGSFTTRALEKKGTYRRQ
jgi:hypothetical protein